MTYVLGIGDHSDCGSALIHDGKVIAAINDERLVREKLVFGVPRESIQAVLDLTGVEPWEIDQVAVGMRCQHLIPEYTDYRDGWFGLERSFFKQLLFNMGGELARLRGIVPGLESAFYLIRQPAYIYRRFRLRQILRREFSLTADVRFLDHHRCHAAAAYYSSGFGPNATVITVDGGGDGASAKAYEVRSGELRELVSVPAFDSLGTLYSCVTEICGFKASRHAGKVTGLAAHGVPRYRDIIESIHTFRDGRFVNTARVFFHSALREIRRRLPDDFRREDLAASIQTHAEDVVTKFARHWVGETGFPDLAMAGGVLANVRVNQCVHELPEVNRCFVHPGMSDCGIGVGAALAVYHGQAYRESHDTRCLEDVYLGPSYGKEEIENVLRRAGLNFQHPECVDRVVARLLAEGAVVARFRGRMEYGPRALGNRSVLYQPTDPEAMDWLNAALSRSSFMPFSPSVLEEEAERCFHGLEGAERTARFMTMTFDCTAWMRENCPGVVHIDGTARPQLVRHRDNPSFHRLLVEYRRLTRLPCLLNTSFNLHEEPIVCTPEDAIRAFRQSGLDYLAIGPMIVKHPSPIRKRKPCSRKGRVTTAA